MEHILKAVELAAKYAWASSVAIAFVLFVPWHVAVDLGIHTIRTAYRGYLWIGLVASLALFVSSAGPALKSFFLSYWTRRAEHQKAAEAKASRRGLMLERLRGLSPDELGLLQYCLYHGQQTVFGEAHHPIAGALIGKRMMVMGSGTVWRVPYTFGDEAWALAREHVEEFLPVAVREHPNAEAFLAKFEKNLKPQVL
ncbi:superinfection exclusion B family protein [Massilia sp. IC2-477]|uniref:super-infection exclusion protein B n=1 Tax=Massilia sp. IC2-477 TaxID=2887198 RepID=UPI001D110FE8|nr:super-infection exclusion protein B [Massilia sp. IC2-477]MCC2956605.1 superinfection exclusion B family protein [Massilia sp. IC2-477]